MHVLCSTADAPTRDLLNSQHLTNDELCALVDYCYKTSSREGLQVAAMVLLGIYGGLRWARQPWQPAPAHTAVLLGERRVLDALLPCHAALDMRARVLRQVPRLPGHWCRTPT